MDYSSSLYKANEKEVETMPTVCTIRGSTKVKLLVTVMNKISPFTFLLSEGDFKINFPYFKEGKIPDLLLIELFKSKVYDIPLEMILNAFGVK